MIKDTIIKEEDKFIVIKTKDIEYIKKYHPSKYTLFKSILKYIDNKNGYIVCNQDEPYADELWELILDGERRKLQKRRFKTHGRN